MRTTPGLMAFPPAVFLCAEKGSLVQVRIAYKVGGYNSISSVVIKQGISLLKPPFPSEIPSDTSVIARSDKSALGN